ncbi:hypothetical protein EMPS_06944 [Entomortierella parvispora]|uniref:Uncharacterized protein n=1 Tax=Entomortierella parvispora TaxID=205924 RepID=A0A9P3HD57_9FUNG|nr:hypothetical protein EMPS_06944 [Entomortierella parvispora]
MSWSDPEFIKDFIRSSHLPQPSRFLTPEIVIQESQAHVKNIFDDWNLLNRIILRHEASIQKRWLKKSREQRRNTLLHAWPQMPKKHLPDLEVYLDENSNQPSNNPAYLWPSINQEDLLRPKILLIFLNARGRHYPSVFTAADELSFKLGRVGGKKMPGFLNEYTMLFTGRNSRFTYGQLYSWDEHEDVFDWQMSGSAHNPGLGLMILEVQERIYRFLVNCCLRILHMTRKDAMDDITPIGPEPPAISMIDGPMYSLSDVAAATPYSVPAKLDLGRLRELIAARRSTAEDHFWSLREDPGYFEKALLEMKDHRGETLLDIRGRPHSLMSTWKSNEFWKRVVSKLILEASGMLEVWHILLSQIDKLIALQKKYDGQLKVESPLPEELLMAFLDLEFSIDVYMKIPLTSLKQTVVASPPLRRWFARMPEENPRMIAVTPKPSVSKDETQTRLLWLFQTLFDERQRFLIGVLPVLDMMERLVQNDPKSRDLFSSIVADSISDYSLLAEVQRQIQLFQPWASTFEHDAVERTKIIRPRYIARTKRLAQVEEAFGSIDTSVADPSDKKFYYPADKRRTKENTLAMQKAEKNLDEFWDMVDRTLLKTVNNSKNGEWTCLLPPDRTLQRTPDWVEPAPAVSVLDRKKAGDQVEELMLGLELRSESTTDNKETKQQQKEKVKTRGTAAAPAAKTTTEGTKEETNVSSQVEPQPTFKLDKKALKVFSTLFYQPSTSSKPGEIPWSDFLHAMTKTGFTAEKMLGSAWHFSPINTDMGRSIQFHEPHPSSKIPFNIARGFGRRLFRNYGWRGDMFVLEDPKV